jgi:hypothetical protein
MTVPPEKSPTRSQAFYSPGALVFYALLTPPSVAFFLWGVNIRRRGGSRIGLAMMVVAGLATVALLLMWALKGQIPWSPGGGLGVLFVLMKMEFSLHEQDILRGGAKASWWVPLVGLFLLITIAGVLQSVTDHETTPVVPGRLPTSVATYLPAAARPGAVLRPWYASPVYDALRA